MASRPSKRTSLDLTANPTLEERRRMVQQDFMIGAEPAAGDTFHAVVTFPQVAVNDNALGLVCAHYHPTLAAALICANQLANGLAKA